jgi:hypothetical protein
VEAETYIKTQKNLKKKKSFTRKRAGTVDVLLQQDIVTPVTIVATSDA